MLMCFSVFKAVGQTTVTIGTGTSTDYSNPFETYFNYGWSSQLYLQSEIGAAGTISAIGFYVTNSGASYTLTNQKIYVRHTSATSHADKYYPTTTGFTLVYDGSITFGTSGWKTISLTTPFAYNGTSNLEVMVESRDGSTFTSAVQSRYTNQSGSGIYRTKYDYNDYSFPSSYQAGGKIAHYSNIQFTINTCTFSGGTASASATTVCSDGSSTLSLSGNSGTPIQWQSSTDNVTFTDISGATNATYAATSLTATKYYRAKIGSGSCIVYSTSTLVTVNSLPSTPTAGNNGPVCVGSALSLTSSTVSGATYSWTGPNGFTSTSQNPIVSSNVTTVMSGLYSVTASENGCVSLIGTTNVSIDENSVGTLSSNKSGVCLGEAFILSTQGQNSGATLQWEISSDNNEFSILSDVIGTDYTNSSPTASTYYRVKYNFGVCSQQISNVVYVQVSQIESIITSSSNTEVCSRDQVLMYSNELEAATTIQWYASSNNSNFTLIEGATGINYNSAPITEETYFKSIKSNSICSKSSNVIHVTLNCPIQSSMTSGNKEALIVVNVESKPDKVGPYYYIFQNEIISSLETILTANPQFSETSTPNTTMTIPKVPEGDYNLKVYDSRGIALIDQKFQIANPIEFIDGSGFTVNNNTIISNGTSALGSINQVITNETKASIKYKVVNPSAFNYVGFQDVNSGLNQLSDIKYGFTIQNNNLFAVENGTLIDLQVSAYPNMEFELRQGLTGIEYWNNTGLLRQSAYPTDNFTFNESISLDSYGRLDHFGKGMEYVCLECIPSISVKSSLNACLQDNGEIEVDLVTNGATITSFKLFSESNNQLTYDPTSSATHYYFKNLQPGDYTYEYKYKYNYGNPYWYNSTIKTVIKKITVDSKITWTSFVNSTYVSSEEAVKGTSLNGTSFGSAVSLNEGRLDGKIYRIDFESASLYTGFYQNPSTKTILSFDDNVNPNLPSMTDLQIMKIENSYQTYFQIGSFKWNESYLNNDDERSFYYEGQKRIFNHYFYRYEYNSINNTVALYRINSRTQVVKTLIAPITLSSTKQIRNVYFYSNYDRTGISNVKSNLHCKVINYVKLEREIRGVNYKPTQNFLYFYYDEEYTGSSNLTYRVLDKNIQVIVSSATLNLVKTYGDNRYSLDVNSIPAGSYVLEVKNEKNEKFYLRFTK